MIAHIDIAGQRFGRLVAISRNEKVKGQVAKWSCVCDCGAYKDVVIGNLTSGSVRSCGCLKSETSRARRLIDITGQTFGKLTVISSSGMRKGQAIWDCECSCGNLTSVSTGKLRSGNTKSCGCGRITRQFDDLTGRQFGESKVLSLHKRGTNSIYVCKCSCGRRFRTKTSHLKAKSTNPMCKNCANVNRIQSNIVNKTTHGHTADGQTAEYIAWCRAKYRSKIVSPDLENFVDFLRHVGKRPEVNYRLKLKSIEMGLVPGNVYWQKYAGRLHKSLHPKSAALPTLPWAKPKQTA